MLVILGGIDFAIQQSLKLAVELDIGRGTRVGRDLALGEYLEQHGRQRITHDAGVADVGGQRLERARLRLGKGLGAGAGIACGILVGHELVLQRRAARGDLLELRRIAKAARRPAEQRSEEHTSELQSLMRLSYAVFCLKKKK